MATTLDYLPQLAADHAQRIRGRFSDLLGSQDWPWAHGTAASGLNPSPTPGANARFEVFLPAGRLVNNVPPDAARPTGSTVLTPVDFGSLPAMGTKVYNVDFQASVPTQNRDGTMMTAAQWDAFLAGTPNAAT